MDGGTHNWDSNCDVAPEWEGEGTQQGVGIVRSQGTQHQQVP